MNEAKQLTIDNLRNICLGNKYILLRDKENVQYGYNCKAFNIAKRKHDYQDSHVTPFYSYISCDIKTYITFKTPFLQ